MEDWREYHKSYLAEDFADAFATYMYYRTFNKYLAPRWVNVDILKEIMIRFGDEPELYVLTESHTIRNMVDKGVIYWWYFNWL